MNVLTVGCGNAFSKTELKDKLYSVFYNELYNEIDLLSEYRATMLDATKKRDYRSIQDCNDNIKFLLYRIRTLQFISEKISDALGLRGE